MRIPVQVAVKDALVVDGVDADFARTMQDMLAVEKNSDMNDITLGIIKKCKITG